jgi:hypothetical protein
MIAPAWTWLAAAGKVLTTSPDATVFEHAVLVVPLTFN